MDGFYIATAGEKGERGEPGVDGTRWFDGHGPPADVGEAREKDYYIDVDTGKVYKLMWS